MALAIGKPAPYFVLPCSDGSLFSLAERLKHGPIVLIFYPLDQSPTCTKFLCAINDEVSEFAAAGLQLAGINFAEPGSHRRFADNKHLSMPLLSDSNYRVAVSYDAVFKIGPFKFIRYAIVGIGQDGLVKLFQYGRPSNAAVISGMQAA